LCHANTYRHVDDHAVNDNALADALTYHLKLVQASTGAGWFDSYVSCDGPLQLFSSAAAPAWFHLAMQQLLDPINQRLDTLTTRLDRLTTITKQSARLSAIVRFWLSHYHHYNNISSS
jgi:hypothetical protein